MTSFPLPPYWGCFIRSWRNVNLIIKKWGTYQDGAAVGGVVLVLLGVFRMVLGLVCILTKKGRQGTGNSSTSRQHFNNASFQIGHSTNGTTSSSTQANPSQPNNNTNTINNNQQDNNPNKRNITIVVPYMPGTGEKFKKLCKSKGIQVHFKGTNTLRTFLGTPRTRTPKTTKQASSTTTSAPK